MTTQKESPVIVRPEDPELVTKLRRKLEEYKERIKDYHDSHPSQHPDYRDRLLAGTICQMTILEQVLEEGRIVGWDASKELVEAREVKDEGSGPAFVDGWTRAWPVIADYCETGGVNVGTGTGLR